MKFNTAAESFNHYRNSSIQEIETRAAQIKKTIETDSTADVTALNIEITGLNQAKENIIENQKKTETEIRGQFNPITGGSFETRASEAALTGDVFASPEYRSAFFKTLLGQNLTAFETAAFNRAQTIVDTEKRADAFNTVTNAVAVLPTQTLNEVISKARTMGGLLPQCRSFNIPTKISVPVGTPTSKAAWHVEGAAVETEKETIATVAFNGYEILKIFSISVAAKKMSISAFESYITDELTACVMETIADSIVNGAGTTEGTGIESIAWVKDANAIEYTKGTIPTYTNFVSTMGKLKRGYSAGAKWACNNATLYTHIYNIVDDNKRPIFIADPKQESIGYILGREVVIDDNIADGDIYLGNWAYMGYNIPEGIVIEVSRESSFKSGLIDYRAIAVADTKPIVTEAFVKLYEAAL
ncbi:phage major capsid protein [Acetobacterium carbinolicum]|uniref:phage major capsid protein n=1 Tax=Acetobacterium carbinolicum TaxID=52690 RepID=UPI0039BF570E